MIDESHRIDEDGDQERVFWPDDRQEPNRRLVVRCVNGDFDLADEEMPFRGATRCKPSRRTIIHLTLEEVEWLRDALAQTVEVETARRAAGAATP